ncbi:hypothetical protein [Deinococcus fonticola]|uniref:hypothetical protein n=1 Tax=Deinococcus fonticola TaxID=2528713 RepID=UPI0010751070|nr:hypothetical protein [Deinococcus fonticola]
MTSFDLGGGYLARPVSVAEYRAACARLEGRIFGGNWLYDFGPPVKSPPPTGETFTGTGLGGMPRISMRGGRTQRRESAECQCGS